MVSGDWRWAQPDTACWDWKRVHPILRTGGKSRGLCELVSCDQETYHSYINSYIVFCVSSDLRFLCFVRWKRILNQSPLACWAWLASLNMVSITAGLLQAFLNKKTITFECLSVEVICSRSEWLTTKHKTVIFRSGTHNWSTKYPCIFLKPNEGVCVLPSLKIVHTVKLLSLWLSTVQVILIVCPCWCRVIQRKRGYFLKSL